MSVVKILEIILGGVGSLLLMYLTYGYHNQQRRLKTLEDGLTEQKVLEQSFMDYKEFKGQQDEEFKEALGNIESKLDNIKEAFNNKFMEMLKAIHSLELKKSG